jgi:hypothetical protein
MTNLKQQQEQAKAKRFEKIKSEPTTPAKHRVTMEANPGGDPGASSSSSEEDRGEPSNPRDKGKG